MKQFEVWVAFAHYSHYSLRVLHKLHDFQKNILLSFMLKIKWFMVGVNRIRHLFWHKYWCQSLIWFYRRISKSFSDLRIRNVLSSKGTNCLIKEAQNYIVFSITIPIFHYITDDKYYWLMAKLTCVRYKPITEWFYLLIKSI